MSLARAAHDGHLNSPLQHDAEFALVHLYRVIQVKHDVLVEVAQAILLMPVKWSTSAPALNVRWSTYICPVIVVLTDEGLEKAERLFQQLFISE